MPDEKLRQCFKDVTLVGDALRLQKKRLRSLCNALWKEHKFDPLKLWKEEPNKTLLEDVIKHLFTFGPASASGGAGDDIASVYTDYGIRYMLHEIFRHKHRSAIEANKVATMPNERARDQAKTKAKKDARKRAGQTSVRITHAHASCTTTSTCLFVFGVSTEISTTQRRDETLLGEAS